MSPRNPPTDSTTAYLAVAGHFACGTLGCKCDKARRRREGMVHCPLCGDTVPSLHVKLHGDAVHIRCTAGCADAEVQATTSHLTTDLPARYDGLHPHHAQLLIASVIPPDLALARGYRTVEDPADLRALGFADYQCRTPGLLLPIYNLAGEIASYQFRPDDPRIDPRKNKPVKYETPRGAALAPDTPPTVRHLVRDPDQPLIWTEGVRKADAAAAHGLPVVALCGVDALMTGVVGSRGTRSSVVAPDLLSIPLKNRRVCIVYDSDVATKPECQAALQRTIAYLVSRGARVAVAYLPPLPNGGKCGLDDYFALGFTVPDLESCIKAVPANRAMDADANGDLPWINAAIQNLRVITPQTWTALQQKNEPPFLFRHGGELARLEVDDEGRPVLRHLTPDRLCHELARAANFYKEAGKTKKGQPIRQIVLPPSPVVHDLLASPDPPLPVITRIVECPIFAADGSLETTPGYCPASRTYLAFTEDLDLPPISDTPTPDEIRRAVCLLVDELMGDFPFATQADRAHAVAMLLLPFVRELIDGPTPGHMVESPSPGSGKGLLVDVTTSLAVGQHVGVIAAAREDEEWRKRISAQLREGHAVVKIDNITYPLDSGALAAALTALTWDDRLLGKNETIHVPVRCLWTATANNPVLSTEMTRRFIRIRMDAEVERAWERTGFRHPDLRTWAREQSGALTWAALTLVRAWLAAGRPPFTTRSLGSFEQWSAVIGGILATAGIDGFLENLTEFYEAADTEGAVWNQFVLAWWEQYGSAAVGVGDLFDLAVETPGLDLGKGGERAQKTTFGVKLTRLRDRVIGNFRVVCAGEKQRAKQWQLQSGGSEPSELRRTFPLRRFQGVDAQPTPSGEEGGNVHSGSSGSLGSSLAPVASVDAPTAPPPPAAPPEARRALAYTWVRTRQELAAALPVLTAASVLALDCETARAGDAPVIDPTKSALDPRRGRLRLVQLATPEHAYVIDAFAVDLAPLATVLSGSALFLGHNLKFDLGWLLGAGLPLPDRLFDSYLAAQLLDAGLETQRGHHSLESVARRLLQWPLDKTQQTSDWAGDLTPAQLTYAANDVAVLLPLADKLQTLLDKAGLGGVAAIEMDALSAVTWMEHNGVPLDLTRWQALIDDAKMQQAGHAAELDRLIQEAGIAPPSTKKASRKQEPARVNWSSDLQVKAILSQLDIRVPNLQEATLRRVQQKHPLIGELLACRAGGRAAARKLADHISPATGRIHANWHQLGAPTGRMSCSEPNLQAVPTTSAVRACIRAPEGRVLVKADYSQIELRVLAVLTSDARMLQAFADGADLHTITAQAIRGTEQVTSEDRKAAKAVNFGLAFGMGTTAFREYARNQWGLTLGADEAEQIHRRYLATYPQVAAWQRKARNSGMLDTRTLLGRRRRGVRDYTEKLNAPVQGSAADGLKLAMGLLWRTRERCPSARLVLAVHDELVVEVDAAQAEAARDWLVECMTAGMAEVLPDVPVEVEAKIGTDWAMTDSPAVAVADAAPMLVAEAEVAFVREGIV
jgi:DNA polymerase I-like protein with 3'-5' exonuclease and polymerase domains